MTSYTEVNTNCAKVARSKSAGSGNIVSKAPFSSFPSPVRHFEPTCPFGHGISNPHFEFDDNNNNNINADDRWQQPPPIWPEIRCPICGHKPMVPLDPNVRMTSFSIITENKKEFFIDTHIFHCEKCRNIQSFLKDAPLK